MFKALKSPRSVLSAYRPVTVCTVLLSTIVLTAGPALAEQLRMDHENVTVEPIEVTEDSPGIPAEASHGAFEPIYEDQAPTAASKPILDKGKAVPTHETADSSEKTAPIEVEPVIHEPVDTGPEVDPQPAATVPDLFVPAEAKQSEDEVAAESAPEPDTVDPLMEAAEAHDEADGVEDDQSETIAAEPAKAPVQAAAPAATPAASKPAKKSVKVAAVAPEKKTDIYDQWAHSKFKGRKEKAPHPLAMQHPDNFVVVCEAGCAQNPVEIVYMERRDARGPVNEKPLKSGIVAGTSSIDCVGGCYEERNSYGAVAATWDPSATVTESEWMTTVKKAGDKPADKKEADSSSRWYERIN